MNRRAFLASASALFPAASLEAFAQPSAPSPRLVPAGEDIDRRSHSRGFSSILFKVLPRETSGALFIIEHENLLKGGPPLHLHHAQEEWFYLISGEVLFQVGDRRLTLHPGDSLLGPRGIPHAFSSIGAAPGHMLIAFTPAGQMESFFRDTAIPNPPLQDAAFFRRYGMELLGPNPLAT